MAVEMQMQLWTAWLFKTVGAVQSDGCWIEQCRLSARRVQPRANVPRSRLSGKGGVSSSGQSVEFWILADTLDAGLGHLLARTPWTDGPLIKDFLDVKSTSWELARW